MLYVHDLSHISVQRYGKFSIYANFLRVKIQLAVFGRTAISSAACSYLLRRPQPPPIRHRRSGERGNLAFGENNSTLADRKSDTEYRIQFICEQCIKVAIENYNI